MAVDIGLDLNPDGQVVGHLKVELVANLLGINHERLTFRLLDHDYRLTNIHGSLVKGVIA